MKTISGVYKITNKINQRFYIGSSTNIQYRFIKHTSELNRKNHSNEHLQRAWCKYGKENFVFSILVIAEEKYIRIIEQKLINKFSKNKKLYNMQTKVLSYSKSRSKNISLSLKGLLVKERNGRFKKISKDKEQKIVSLYLSGYSIEGVCSSVGVGHTVVERILRENNISTRKVGTKINLGKTKRKQKVLQFTQEGKFIKEWESIIEASRSLNICRDTITNSCTGKFKKSKFLWRYADFDCRSL